jgi:hypothetical protein
MERLPFFSNTIGNFNTAIGLQALGDNTTGNPNTLIGRQRRFPSSDFMTYSK